MGPLLNLLGGLAAIPRKPGDILQTLLRMQSELRDTISAVKESSGGVSNYADKQRSEMGSLMSDLESVSATVQGAYHYMPVIFRQLRITYTLFHTLIAVFRIAASSLQRLPDHVYQFLQERVLRDQPERIFLLDDLLPTMRTGRLWVFCT